MIFNFSKKQSERKLSLRAWFGKNYDELLRVLYLVYYIVIKTGKGAKKTTFVAKLFVLIAVLDPYMCGVVLKKFMKDHGTTTFASIEKAFKELRSKTGYDYEKEWVITPSSKNPKIENKRTGQIFRFSSFDKPNSLAGFDLKDKYLYYGPIWWEEPLEVDEFAKKPTLDEQKLKRRLFEIILNSVHRGQLPHQWAHRWCIKTFNDWSDGNSWILMEFIKPFIDECIKTLDTKGKQIYFDPKFKDKGLFVMVASAGINEFLDSDFLKTALEIRNNDFEFYKAIWLGTRATFVGNAYGIGNVRKIKRNIDLNLVEHFFIGWDYSSTIDKTVLVLNGVNYHTFEQQIIDAEKYAGGEHQNPMDDKAKIKWMWQIIEKWNAKYDFISRKKRVGIYGDSRDSVVCTFLANEWLNSPIHIRNNFVKPDKAAKFNSASNFVRIMATRYLMGAGKLRIAKHLDWLLDEFNQRTIEIDGQLKDRGDDGCQAYEYSWSRFIHKLIPNQYYKWLLSENSVKVWESRNAIHENAPFTSTSMT